MLHVNRNILNYRNICYDATEFVCIFSLWKLKELQRRAIDQSDYRIQGISSSRSCRLTGGHPWVGKSVDSCGEAVWQRVPRGHSMERSASTSELRKSSNKCSPTTCSQVNKRQSVRGLYDFKIIWRVFLAAVPYWSLHLLFHCVWSASCAHDVPAYWVSYNLYACIWVIDYI